jgi:SAM-dependent methyltransferase
LPRHAVQPLNSDQEALAVILRRQFAESGQLRRHIYGQLPLRKASVILEPGCGTGLVLQEVSRLSDAVLVGIDRDAGMLDVARRNVPLADFRLADILECRLPPADGVLISHVLLHLSDPHGFARKLFRSLRAGGFVAVLGEYDWLAAEEEPREGLLDLLTGSLRADGLLLETAGEMSTIFETAGFIKVSGGRACGGLSSPDDDLIALQMPSARSDGHPEVSWTCRLLIPLLWAIYIRP